jgi:hypothetical protein
MALITCYAKRNTLLWIFGACLIGYLVLVNPKPSCFANVIIKRLYGSSSITTHTCPNNHPAPRLHFLHLGIRRCHGTRNCCKRLDKSPEPVHARPLTNLFRQYESGESNEATKKRATEVRQRQESLKAEAESADSDMVPMGKSAADKAEKVLVTGGLGFIGSHVVEELLKRGKQVVIFDDESNGHNHNKLAREIKGDVSVVKDFSKV